MAYLEITLKISSNNRPSAAKVYTDYKEPFLKQIKGAQSKELLIRDEDVQVLHGFASTADAKAYLESELFNGDVVKALAPYLDADPDIRIYDVI
jgi:Holliday junction resolvase